LLAATVSSHTTRACGGKEWANLDSRSQAFLTPAGTTD
jgi:hypothetical protein